MIYAFGNSHAHLFTRTPYGDMGWGKETKHFHSFSLRPLSAKHFEATHGFAFTEVLRKYKKGDYILITIGERDCSEHIPIEAYMTKKPLDGILRDHIDTFMRPILLLQAAGIDFIGWGGHPVPPEDKPTFNMGQGDMVVEVDPKLKKEISLVWDNYLGFRYTKAGIKYISVMRDLLTESGDVNMKYFPPGDTTHLDYDAMYPLLTQKFKDQGIEVSFE